LGILQRWVPEKRRSAALGKEYESTRRMRNTGIPVSEGGPREHCSKLCKLKSHSKSNFFIRKLNLTFAASLMQSKKMPKERTGRRVGLHGR